MNQKEYNRMLWGTIAGCLLVTLAALWVSYNIGKIVALTGV